MSYRMLLVKLCSELQIDLEIDYLSFLEKYIQYSSNYTVLLSHHLTKRQFLSESLIRLKKIFQITILSKTFKFPAPNSKQLIQNLCFGSCFEVCIFLSLIKFSSKKLPPKIPTKKSYPRIHSDLYRYIEDMNESF